MFKKIVLLTSKKKEGNDLALELASQQHSRLIVMALIEPKQIVRMVQGRGRKEDDVREELESKAWQELYQLESDFKKSGVEVSLFLEEASILELESFLRSIKTDLLILPVEHLRYYNYKLTEEFLTDLPCPVLLVGKP
ncbi:MAG: hypothetical protein OEZ20_06505 [candidate division WOR-3 bacterium]|nr:hypothetical protein [candidate division WOR-3 bacterium]MDH5684095.1 hypothetical protein [candidate division WOR-3 bacterium]